MYLKLGYLNFDIFILNCHCGLCNGNLLKTIIIYRVIMIINHSFHVFVFRYLICILCYCKCCIVLKKIFGIIFSIS